ncbi:MAG: 16S rRNA (uracil(1498)-N(3))-methyltransferase [Alphaproteobacteria bacterium]|nr:16S rRNA (uracil(1498)-N(3))-methyltransferase [Alphaproteobacteria bacterium]
MIRLYVEGSPLENQVFSLPKDQSHYIQNVMRLGLGDEILVFNGFQGEWKAKITANLKKSTELIVLSQTRPQPVERDLWLLFSPLKGKRQEFLEEKATELGVSRLWPIRCERTSVSKINLEKMHSHVKEAAEQCGRLTLPQLNPLCPLSQVLSDWSATRNLIFGDETLTSLSLKDLTLDPKASYAFLVGPEGGFTPQEFSLLRRLPNAQGVTLNANILRAETAALVGLSYLQLKNEEPS